MELKKIVINNTEACLSIFRGFNIPDTVLWNNEPSKAEKPELSIN